MARKKGDVRIMDNGSVVLIYPVSEAAKDWMDENVSLEGGWHRLGGGFACEPRMVEALLEGMSDAGLVLY